MEQLRTALVGTDNDTPLATNATVTSLASPPQTTLGWALKTGSSGGDHRRSTVRQGTGTNLRLFLQGCNHHIDLV